MKNKNARNSATNVRRYASRSPSAHQYTVAIVYGRVDFLFSVVLKTTNTRSEIVFFNHGGFVHSSDRAFELSNWIRYLTILKIQWTGSWGKYFSS